MIKIKKNNNTLLELNNTSSDEKVYIKLGDGLTDPVFKFPEKGGVIATDADIPKNQVTLAVAIDFVTNINGRQMVHYIAGAIEPENNIYEVSYIPDPEQPSQKEEMTEERAAEYLHYITGSQYVPKYNYDFPHNTYIVLADGSMWKPQHDYGGENGKGRLLLWRMPKVFATTADLNDYISKTNIDQTFFNNLF